MTLPILWLAQFFFLVSLFHSPIPHSFVIFFKFSRWIGFHLHQIYVFFFSLTILFSIKVFFYVEKNARTRNFYPQVKIEIKKNACITCIDFSVSLNFHLIHLLQGGNHARFVKAKYRQRETASKREKKKKEETTFLCVSTHRLKHRPKILREFHYYLSGLNDFIAILIWTDFLMKIIQDVDIF